METTLEQFTLFDTQPQIATTPVEPIAEQPVSQCVQKQPTEDAKLSELATLVDKYSHRIWPKGGQHLKRSIAQAKRFDTFHDNPDLLLKNIEAEHIIDFLDTLVTDGASPRTANRYAATLSSVFKFAKKLGKIDDLPHVPFAEEGEGRLVTYTDEQVSDFIEFFQTRGDTWMSDIIITAFNSGMRKGEVVKIGNIIESELCRKEKTLTIYKTKNGKQRTIPLNRNAFDAVCRLHDEGMTHYTHRKFYDRWSLLKQVFRLGKGDVFHALRHTAASKLANEHNANPFVMAELLGHLNLKTTQKYVHADQNSLRNLVDALGA